MSKGINEYLEKNEVKIKLFIYASYLICQLSVGFRKCSSIEKNMREMFLKAIDHNGHSCLQLHSYIGVSRLFLRLLSRRKPHHKIEPHATFRLYFERLPQALLNN